MPAGAVQKHHRVNVRRERLGERFQEKVHGRRVHVRHQPRMRFAAAWADGGEQVDPAVLRLPRRAGAAPAFGPYARERALLAKARFVLRPKFKPFAGMLLRNVLEARLKVF